MTLVITDPCYMKGNGSLMQRNTIYGDWSCMVYPGKLGENEKYKEWDEKYFQFFNEYNFSGKNDEEKKSLLNEFNEFKDNWKKDNILGEFTADAGLVGVFDWDELSEENKTWAVEHPWCAAIIKQWTGNVEFEVNDETVHVVGTGEKPFFTVQSGF